jgi:uncharacterized protein (TIGR02646 family)
MKHIKKHQKNEPKTLKNYRKKTPNPTYSGFIDSGQLLKISLLKEQGHICAYCMQRIGLELNEARKPHIEVEHYLSQKHFSDKQLDYKNMLGVCNGNSGIQEHCDKSKKHQNLSALNPLKKDYCESLLTYSISGKIESLSNNISVINDINLLNLNAQNLIDIRRKIMDSALEKLKEKLTKAHPNTQWTKKMIQSEIDQWKSKDSKGRYKGYCLVAFWILEKEKSKSKYP